MGVNILRRINWMGGATFQPIGYDESVFRMVNVGAPGQRVPAHFHDHMSESFLIREGETIFYIGTERREVRAAAGDRIVAPIGVVHAFANSSNGPVTFEVEFRPAADMPRMMAIIAGLQDEHESAWLLKYVYLEKRDGLHPFSHPVGALGVISNLLLPLILLYGDLAGWKRLVGRYTPSAK